MAITYVGAPSATQKQILCSDADIAGLPVTGVANGSTVHVVDTGVMGVFFGSEWRNVVGGAALAVGAGKFGTVGAFPLVANKIVTSTSMKNGTYTIAAQPIAPALLSVLSTAAAAADTMGTLSIVGTDRNGNAQTEVVTPISGVTVFTTKVFKTVTTITGADWVINSTNDTIVVGVAAIIPPTGFYFSYLQVVTAMVVAAQVSPAGWYVADFTKHASIPAGTYPTRLTSITITSGEGILGLSQV